MFVILSLEQFIRWSRLIAKSSRPEAILFIKTVMRCTMRRAQELLKEMEMADDQR